MKAKLPLIDPAIIDEYGDLDNELKPWKPQFARAEALRKLIRAHYADAPEADFYLAVGTSYDVILGAKASESKVNIKKLIQRIGLKSFATFASVTLKALRECVNPVIAEECVDTAATGSRTLQVMNKVRSD